MLITVETKVKVKMNVYEFVYKCGENAYVHKEVFSPDVSKKEVVETLKGISIENGGEFVAITNKTKEIRIYKPTVQIDLDGDNYDVISRGDDND